MATLAGESYIPLHIIFTDHKNLEYLRLAKRLSTCQARWALFFTRFRFTVHFRPGSRNTKVDILFRHHPLSLQPECPETILPPTCFIKALTWEIDELIATMAPHQIPEECPEGRTFVPTHLRSRLITWAHAASHTRDPGIQHTHDLLHKY